MEAFNSATKAKRNYSAGYTLVEVLVASSILMLGISAACVMSLTMVTQEEMSHRMARALNAQENAARLFQLGVDNAQISADPTVTTGILPACSDVALSIDAVDGTVAGVGTLDAAAITATIYTTEPDSTLAQTEKGWTAGARRSDSPVARASRTNILTVYRSPVP